MSFLVWNNATHCPHRRAGRAMCRRWGMGALSLAKLGELLGLAYRFPRGVW